MERVLNSSKFQNAVQLLGEALNIGLSDAFDPRKRTVTHRQQFLQTLSTIFFIQEVHYGQSTMCLPSWIRCDIETIETIETLPKPQMKMKKNVFVINMFHVFWICMILFRVSCVLILASARNHIFVRLRKLHLICRRSFPKCTLCKYLSWANENEPGWRFGSNSIEKNVPTFLKNWVRNKATTNRSHLNFVQSTCSTTQLFLLTV